MPRAYLVGLAHRAPRIRPRPAAALAFLLGAVLTVVSATRLVANNEAEAKRRFDVLAERTTSTVTARMQKYEYALRGTRGAVIAAGGEDFERGRLEDYNATRDFEHEFPGVLGVGVARRVAERDEARFVALAQRTRPRFGVQQLSPHAGERFVIEHLDPEARNQAALGIDLASDLDRRTAALRAMRTGAATLTGPITLVQEMGKPRRSFILMLPIYRAGATLETLTEREDAAFGWAIAPMVVDDVLAGLDLAPDGIALVLSDVTAEPQPFFTSDSGAEVDPRFGRAIAFEIYGRRWAADVRATPSFVRNLHPSRPRTVVIVGLTLSALLATLLFLFTRGRQRSREVWAEQARRASIVESSTDAIIAESMDGVITDWNGGAERLFGYSREMALGRSAVGLIHPAGREHEDRDIRAAISRGERVPAFDTTRRRADGALLEVSIMASPIVAADGRRLGFSKTVRDITGARRTQRELAELNARLEEQVAERTAKLDAAVHHLEAIVAAVPSTIGYWDRSLVNRMANRAYGEVFGRDPATLPGTTLRELVGDVAFQKHEVRVQGVLAGEPQAFELTLPAAGGGGARHLLVRFVPDRVNCEVKGFYAFTHDVTELVEARLHLAAAQRDAAALLRTIHEHTIVSVTDRTGRILEVNDSFCAISGYAREALVGRSHGIVNSGFHPREFWQEIWRIIGSGKSWRGEICNRAADGSLFWVESIISPYLGDDGRVEKYISIRTDITARKIAAEDLRRTNERFELAAAAAGLGVWTWDVVTGEATWDAKAFVVFGRSPDGSESAADVWQSTVLEEDRARRDEQIAAAVAGKQPFDLDFRINVPGGGVRHVKSNARVERDVEGNALRMIGVHMDVTERRNAEIALRETSSLLTTVLASASEVAIIATDPSLLVTVFNEGAERLLGYASAEIVGRVTPALIHDAAEMGARADELSKALGRSITGGAIFTEATTLGQAREWTYVRKDGSRVFVSLVITEMRDAGGKLFGYLGIAHDVSAQKDAERSLRHAVHKARSANRAKSQFLANMSHEIRTPMNAVIGLSYLLERTNLDAEQASFLAKIRFASKSLLAIINDILDLSKIEASELKLEHAPVDLAKLLGDLRGLMATQAEAKCIGFTVEVADGLPIVEGDAVRVNQVLTNLLTNAIKFTSSGNVTLRVSTEAAAANCVRVRFAVEDSGIGISAEALPRLFSPFVQADASTTRRFGGTGLGLSIVKQLVALMGGEIGVTSTAGVGSVFWFDLDFTLSVTQAPALPDPRERVNQGPGLYGVRVLVADDSDINLEVARRILELEGAIVTLAGDGQQAVDKLLEAPGGYDVVLLDVQMPVLDGHDATRRIRQGLGLVDLPVIALTAGTLTSEAALAKAAGMSDFVGKPFEPAALVSCIRRFVPGSAGGERSPVLRPRTLAPADWPLLDGIDAQDAFSRLRDRDLFLAMLRRLVDDFTDLADAGSITAPSDFGRALAGRLHNLKGTAGTLGAKILCEHASLAEAACLAGDEAGTRASTQRAVEQLDLLRQQVAAVFLALEAVTEPGLEDGATAPGEVLGEEALVALIALLRSSNLAASERFDELARPLRALLGARAYAATKRHVDDLEFAAAAATLDESRSAFLRRSA